MADTQITIEVPMTAEGIAGLKQACQTIKTQYQKYSLSLAASDENAIYPSLLPSILGMKADAGSGVEAFQAYDKTSLNEIDRPEKAAGDLGSYSEIQNTTGNYPISQKIYDEAKLEADKILSGMKNDELPIDNEEIGGSFKQGTRIDRAEDRVIRSKTILSQKKVTSEKINSSKSSTGYSRPPLKLDIIKELHGAPDSGEAYTQPEYARSSDGRFKHSIQRRCIPCNLRLNGPDDLTMMAEFKNIWAEFLKKIEDMIKQMKELLNNNDILDDICSLLNFLDFQCVPDLFSLLALLAALIQKYSDINLSLDGVFNAFLGAFFGPILGGLSELLDRYIQMIMGPVDCVLGALDTQLAKLDVQKGLRKNNTESLSVHRKREAYLRRKLEQLQERRAYLNRVKDQKNKDGTLKYDPNKAPPKRIGGLPRSSKSNFVRDILESNPETSRSKSFEITSSISTSINEELERIDKDIEDNRKTYAQEYGKGGKNELAKLYKENRNPSPTVIQNARGGMRDFRKGLYSSLFELRQQSLNGRRMINDTLKMYQEELERILFGRVQTAAEQFEGARNLQKIARIIGIVRVLMSIKSLVKDGNLCDNTNGDPSVAIGSFISTYKGSEPAANNHKFYKSADGKTLIVAPSDAVLELIDPKTETVTQIDNLDEVEKLNKDGILKDIGDIANKKIKATSVDLDSEVPVSVVKLDLCTNSDFSTQPDIDKIMNWAQDAGLE